MVDFLVGLLALNSLNFRERGDTVAREDPMHREHATRGPGGVSGLALAHSERSATVGSTLVARRAGRSSAAWAKTRTPS
jgi:hypothetical protein